MPQVFDAVCCAECATFQVQLRGQKTKWKCVICGTQQSYTRIYVTGPAKEVRPVVQSLNASRSTVPEFVTGAGLKQHQHYQKQEQPDEAFSCAWGGGCSAASSHSIEPSPGEERRIDANDGGAFTRAEFVAYYGGIEEWDRSQPILPVSSGSCQDENYSWQHGQLPVEQEEDGAGDVYVTSLPQRSKQQSKRARSQEVDTPYGAGAPQHHRQRTAGGTRDLSTTSWGGRAVDPWGVLAVDPHAATRRQQNGHSSLTHSDRYSCGLDSLGAPTHGRDMYTVGSAVQEVEEEVWQG